MKCTAQTQELILQCCLGKRTLWFCVVTLKNFFNFCRLKLTTFVGRRTRRQSLESTLSKQWKWVFLFASRLTNEKLGFNEYAPHLQQILEEHKRTEAVCNQYLHLWCARSDPSQSPKTSYAILACLTKNCSSNNNYCLPKPNLLYKVLLLQQPRLPFLWQTMCLLLLVLEHRLFSSNSKPNLFLCPIFQVIHNR